MGPNGGSVATDSVNECAELTLVLDLICSATPFHLQDICAVYDIQKRGRPWGSKIKIFCREYHSSSSLPPPPHTLLVLER
jgi:hypothetical protein